LFFNQGFKLTIRILENETEVSFFNRELYEAFKINPEVRLFLPSLAISSLVVPLDQMVAFDARSTTYGYALSDSLVLFPGNCVADIVYNVINHVEISNQGVYVIAATRVISNRYLYERMWGNNRRQ
jgi:hypothetical protein